MNGPQDYVSGTPGADSGENFAVFTKLSNWQGRFQIKSHMYLLKRRIKEIKFVQKLLQTLPDFKTRWRKQFFAEI